MDAADIIRDLDLSPGTCGFMRTSWANEHGAVLYFLITPERVGSVHRLNADQMYHYDSGAPLDVAFLLPSGEVAHHTLGPFGTEGAVVQLLVPANTVHGSHTTGAFTLACTTSFSDGTPVATPPTPAERATMAAAGFE